MNDNEKNIKEKDAEKKSDAVKKALVWIIYVWSIVLFTVMALCTFGMIAITFATCIKYARVSMDVFSALPLFLP